MGAGEQVIHDGAEALVPVRSVGTEVGSEGRPGRGELLVPAAATLLALALALYGLGAKSLWLDEATSAIVAQKGLHDLFSWVVRAEPNQGLFYLFLHLIGGLGQTEWLLRLPSALSVAGTVPVLFWLSRRLFGRRVATAAVFLFALNAFVITHAQEARSYALAILLTTAATAAFVSATVRPSTRMWIAYGVLAVLAVHALLFTALVVVAHACSIPFLPQDRRPGRRAVVTFGAVAVACVPLFALVLRSGTYRISWIPPLAFGRVVEVATGLVGGSRALLLVYAVLVSLSVPTIRARRDRRAGMERWSSALTAVWFLVPTLGIVVISIVLPLLIPRYLIVCVPAVAILAGIGLASVGSRVVRVALVCLIVALSGRALWAWYGSNPEPWREATAAVLAQVRPGDAVVFYPGFNVQPFGYYVQRTPGGPSRAPEPIFPPATWGDGLPWSGPEVPVPRQLEGAERPPRVWLVMAHDDSLPQVIAGRRTLLGALRGSYASVQERSFDGIRILLFA